MKKTAYLIAILMAFQIKIVSNEAPKPYDWEVPKPYDWMSYFQNTTAEEKAARASSSRTCPAPVLPTAEDIAKYTFPNETVVNMNNSNHIIVTPDSPKKTISTFGLCGCLAIVFYARQNGTQIAYLSHDDAIGLESKINMRAFQAINEMRKTTPKPEVVDISVVSPGEYGKNYEFIPQPRYQNLNADLSSMLSREFPQAKVSAMFAPYSMNKSGDKKKFYEGGRDVIVELDPDYRKSNILPKDSYEKILLNKEELS